MDRKIKCATIEGLLLWKLFALPSLYRQASCERVGIYEKDVATLLKAYQPKREPLMAELKKHLKETDMGELQNIMADMEARIRDLANTNNKIYFGVPQLEPSGECKYLDWFSVRQESVMESKK